jgi:inhibitor of cysteine peptidase
MRKLIIGILGLSFLSGMAMADTSTPATANSNSAPAEKAMVVSAGQKQLVVSLTANATTGYQWYVGQYDHQLLKLKNYSYQAPNSNLMGAPGKAVFTFEVKSEFTAAPQITQIQFVYGRAWDVASSSTKLITVVSTPVALTNTASSDNQGNNWMSLPSNASSGS